MNVAAIILAAGGSSRMKGENKLLLPVEGVPMILSVCRNVLSAGYDPTIVVTGYDEQNIQLALKSVDAHIVHNNGWNRGMSGSIQTGVAALPEDAPGCLIMLGDMPLVSVDTLKTLKDTFLASAGKKITYPLFKGRQANPVMFPKHYFHEILSISGDEGCKSVLQSHSDQSLALTMTSAEVVTDCDTQQDYARLLEEIEREPYDPS